jgi:hypothetical protein
MPLQLLAIVLIVSRGKQIGEKLNSFTTFEQNSNFKVLFGLSPLVNKLVKS